MRSIADCSFMAGITIATVGSGLIRAAGAVEDAHHEAREQVDRHDQAVHAEDRVVEERGQEGRLREEDEAHHAEEVDPDHRAPEAGSQHAGEIAQGRAAEAPARRAPAREQRRAGAPASARGAPARRASSRAARPSASTSQVPPSTRPRRAPLPGRRTIELTVARSGRSIRSDPPIRGARCRRPFHVPGKREPRLDARRVRVVDGVGRARPVRVGEVRLLRDRIPAGRRADLRQQRLDVVVLERRRLRAASASRSRTAASR